MLDFRVIGCGYVGLSFQLLDWALVVLKGSGNRTSMRLLENCHIWYEDPAYSNRCCDSRTHAGLGYLDTPQQNWHILVTTQHMPGIIFTATQFVTYPTTAPATGNVHALGTWAQIHI